MFIQRQLKKLFEIVNQLENEYPSRKFTLDGHLIGSIAEVYCQAHYSDLTLYSMSEKAHDAFTENGVKIQIKATQGNKIGLRHEPEGLLVFKIDTEKCTLIEIYNGSGEIAWNKANKISSNGQRFITIKNLKLLQMTTEKIVKINPEHVTK